MFSVQFAAKPAVKLISLMILPAKQHSISKRLFEEDSSSDEEDEEFEYEESEMSEDETDGESDVHKLKNCWKGLAPLTNETEIIGRWYAAIFTTKKTKRLSTRHKKR